MSRRRAAVTALTSFVLLLGPGAAPALAAEQVARSVSAAVATDPVASFAGCLNGGGEGDLLLLFDESNSLTETDPQAARVTAARYLVDQLGAQVDQTEISLDARVAVFGDGYTALGDWTALGGGGTQTVLRLVGGLATRDQGKETDYWSALEFARRDLVERAAARGEEASCQAIAWFTDGELAYVPRDSVEPVPFEPEAGMSNREAADYMYDEAVDRICREGGLADQIRSSEVVTFAIGLDGGNNPDFALLESISTGRSSAESCGSRQNPVPGVFTAASDIDSLLFAFERVLGGGITSDGGICQVEVCSEESHRFVLDNSTPRVHILASAEATGLQVYLMGPKGEQIVLEPNTVGLASSVLGAGAEVGYVWQAERTLAIDLARNGDGGWKGLWSLIFVDPAGQSEGGQSLASLRISSDFRPTVVSPEGSVWHQGDAFDLQLGVLGADGEPIELAVLESSLVLSAQLVTADDSLITLAEGLTESTLETAVSVSLEGVPLGAARLELSLVHTTAPVVEGGEVVEPGTQLQPQTVTLPIQVEPPLDYPTVLGALSFGTLDGTSEATTELRLEGEGCLWLDASSLRVLAGPDEAGALSLDSEAGSHADCHRPSGGPLTVGFAAESTANGTVNGRVTVYLLPEGGQGPAIPRELSVTANMLTPFDPARGATVFFLLLVLGILIPVGLIYLAKFIVARIPGRALFALRIPVSVTDGLVRRDGGSFVLREEDFTTSLRSLPRRGVKRLDLGGVTLKSKMGWAPAGPGYVRVEAPGRVGASDSHPASVGHPPQARMPLAVHGHWAVLRNAAGPTRDAELVVFVPGDAGRDYQIELASTIATELPGVLAQLDEATGQGSAGDEASGGASLWDGESSGSGGGGSLWGDPGGSIGTPGGSSPSGGSRSSPSSIWGDE